jgi:hypothetical protein
MAHSHAGILAPTLLTKPILSSSFGVDVVLYFFVTKRCEPIALFGNEVSARHMGCGKKIFLPDRNEKQPFAGSKKHMFGDSHPEEKNRKNH